VVSQNTTLDRHIEFLDDWFDPSTRGHDVAAFREEMTRQGDASAAMPLGRPTFLDFRGGVTLLRYGLA
jgi:hypothetical protein